MQANIIFVAKTVKRRNKGKGKKGSDKKENEKGIK